MHQLQPCFRDAGTGPGVVCAHANASTSEQWRGLMELLAPKFRVLAPDSYGAGKSPQWPSDRVITLLDEVALMEPVLTRAGAPLALVGHSYGAAVALIAALANPGRVRAMALYEPTLFALLDAETPPPNEAEGTRNATHTTPILLNERRPLSSANVATARHRTEGASSGERSHMPATSWTSGSAGHSAVSSQRNRQADEGAPNLPRLPAPHRRPAMRQWGHRCRQRPTLHPAPQGQRVRCTSACAKLDDFANCREDKVFTASHLDVTLLWEAHPCRGITLAHRKQ